MLYRIVAPHFVCGVVIENGKITTAAPIVKYMLGWTRQRLQTYAAGKGWTVEYIA